MWSIYKLALLLDCCVSNMYKSLHPFSDLASLIQRAGFLQCSRERYDFCWFRWTVIWISKISVHITFNSDILETPKYSALCNKEIHFVYNIKINPHFCSLDIAIPSSAKNSGPFYLWSLPCFNCKDKRKCPCS